MKTSKKTPAKKEKKVTIDEFTDSALAMIADLEMSHGVTFTIHESQDVQSALGETAQRHWFTSKQGKAALEKKYQKKK